MLAPVRTHVVWPGATARAAKPPAQRRNGYSIGEHRLVDAGAPAAVARREDRSHTKAAHVGKVHRGTIEFGEARAGPPEGRLPGLRRSIAGSGKAAKPERLRIRRGAFYRRIYEAASQAFPRGRAIAPQARSRASRRPWSAPVLFRSPEFLCSNDARARQQKPWVSSLHACAPRRLRLLTAAYAATSVWRAAESPI